MSVINPIEAVIWLALGMLLGAHYFFLLHRAVSLLASHATAIRIVLLSLIRFGVALTVFWVIALQGALPLLLALLGFVVARHLAQRLIGVV